jgi:hypothetical protein
MKKTNLFLLLNLIYAFAFAQGQYFQQEVNSTINVTLDDVEHTVKGTISIEYTNNSPNELKEIYFHLWPNAYKNIHTEFAIQQYESGNTDFRFAEEADRGYIDDLDFQVNGKKVTWAYDERYMDIALLTLNSGLKSGETIKIETPFKVKIPKSFSRLGHVETSYQMTQWYPKPAVYDKNGWHPMPYLNQGEFYSEFGSFDVTITLPDNYVVGATGVLQTESEVTFLNELADKTTMNIKKIIDIEKNDFPASSSSTKTIRYTAENVHDFAWFADKRFNVLKGKITLESGKAVDTWAMFTQFEANLWEDAIKYINRSVKYYSDRIGEYPYPHATAVQSALSAGAGMEYPMITVIGESGTGKALDQVITHEVGHNWFYGILGSNERDYVWMDEGFNSFYEEAYIKEFYETANKVGDMLPAGAHKILNEEELDQDLAYSGYLIQARSGEFIAPSSTSRKMTEFNYVLLGYMYPAYLFRYAEAYLGRQEFDRVMKVYYEQWKFKHPDPTDTKAIFEAQTGKNFAWLFGDLFGSTKKLDYAMEAVKSTDGEAVTIKVSNKSDIIAPFSISGLKNGVVLETIWYDGVEGTKEVTFPKTYQGYRIDAEGLMPENNRYNNYIKHSGGKMNAPYLKLLGGLETNKRSVFMLPALGFNAHDGFMLGALFYNSVLPQKKFEYTLAPMYGFNSKNVTGLANFDFYMFPKKENFKHIKVGVNLKSFGKYDNESFGYVENYTKFSPHAEAKFQPTPTSTKATYIKARGIFIQDQVANFDTSGFAGLGNSTRNGYGLSYEFSDSRVLNPYSIKVNLLSNEYPRLADFDMDLRLTVEAEYQLNYYQKKKKAARFRLFAGQFLANTNRDFGAFPMRLTGNAEADFFYDDFFFGRGVQEGLAEQQISLSQGGFRTPMATQSIGQSNSTMLTLNIVFDAPMDFLPISAFVDLAYFEDTRPTASAFKSFYNIGLTTTLFKGAFTLNLPLFGSEELMNAYKSKGGIGKRLSFTLDLMQLNPKALIRGLL